MGCRPITNILLPKKNSLPPSHNESSLETPKCPVDDPSAGKLVDFQFTQVVNHLAEDGTEERITGYERYCRRMYAAFPQRRPYLRIAYKQHARWTNTRLNRCKKNKAVAEAKWYKSSSKFDQQLKDLEHLADVIETMRTYFFGDDEWMDL